MGRIRQWTRIQRSRFSQPLSAAFLPHNEVRLATPSKLENSDGCTLSIRQNHLLIACTDSFNWMESKIAEFLRGEQLIGKGTALDDVEKFIRRKVTHAHEIGRQTSELTKLKKKERQTDDADLTSRRFDSVLGATHAAEEAAGPWLVFTERAKLTAAESCYNDPDYVYQAMMDLAYVAKYHADHNGLGMPWADFLGQLRSHSFVPNTSPNTIERYPNEYHIVHGGQRLCIQAHLRQGNGAAKDCLRIYLVQPRKSGDPIIIGHIGSHLPTAERSH